MAILCNKDINIEINETIKDNTGRLLLINCTIEDTPFTIINVYCPTKDNEALQLKFLSFIEDTIELYGGDNIILGGDLNTYIDINIDKSGDTYENQTKYSKSLNCVIDTYSLVDIWRVRNEQVKRYTRREYSRNGLVQSRLDYFLITKPLEYTIERTEINPSIKSDHSIISITLNFLESQKRGKGFWKLNTKFLIEKGYIDNMKKCIEKAKSDCKNIIDKSKCWDFIKCSIRTESIKYSLKKC